MVLIEREWNRKKEKDIREGGGWCGCVRGDGLN